MVGGNISCGKFIGELGGFGGMSSNRRSVNHGGMGSDSGLGEVRLIVSRECITSGEVVGCD